MGFWSFLRDMFVFDWLFGKSKKVNTRTQDKSKFVSQELDCDCDCNHSMTRNTRYSRSSWDDGHYASNDYYHDSCDDYAHDFDDFEDDF